MLGPVSFFYGYCDAGHEWDWDTRRDACPECGSTAIHQTPVEWDAGP
jgi:rRNA maturation protein Nop10